MNRARTFRAAGQDHTGRARGRRCCSLIGTSLPLTMLALALVANLGAAAENENDSGGDANAALARSRASRVSPHLSAAIRARLPEYKPAPPPPATVERMDEGEDRSDVVVLAPVIVTERRQARGAEWQLLTPAGRAAMLKERYPGATPLGSALTDAVHNYAKLMFTEDTRLGRLAELDKMLEAARVGRNPETMKELKNEILRARMRPNDWRAESMDRSYNNGRR